MDGGGRRRRRVGGNGHDVRDRRPSPFSGINKGDRLHVDHLFLLGPERGTKPRARPTDWRMSSRSTGYPSPEKNKGGRIQISQELRPNAETYRHAGTARRGRSLCVNGFRDFVESVGLLYVSRVSPTVFREGELRFLFVSREEPRRHVHVFFPRVKRSSGWQGDISG